MTASATLTDGRSSPHHAADDDATANDQNVPEATRDEEPEAEGGNKENGVGGGYEGLDAREVEEARLRAQRPAVYVGLRGDQLKTCTVDL